MSNCMQPDFLLVGSSLNVCRAFGMMKALAFTALGLTIWSITDCIFHCLSAVEQALTADGPDTISQYCWAFT